MNLMVPFLLNTEHSSINGEHQICLLMFPSLDNATLSVVYIAMTTYMLKSCRKPNIFVVKYQTY